MASVFKRRKTKGEPYWIQYKGKDGKRKTVKGFTDKGQTELYATKLENDARLRQTGMIDETQEILAQSKMSPLERHLLAFEKSLIDTTTKHVTLTVNRIRRMVRGCKIAKLGDIDGEKVRDWLWDYCKENDIGHRTFNHYIQAFDSFCNWCVKTKRLLLNPLLGVERKNAETDVRHPRRALSPGEFGKLIESARSSRTSIQGFSGEQRARIYLLSYLTGLRRQELASLTVRSFALDATPPNGNGAGRLLQAQTARCTPPPPQSSR